MKALQSTPRSIYLKWYLQEEVRLCSAAILKFATRRAGLGVLDSTIPLLSKASMRVPLSSCQGCTTVFCLGGGGGGGGVLNKVFYTQAGCAPSLVYTIFYRKGIPFVRPSKIEGRGGGGEGTHVLYFEFQIRSFCRF